MTESKIFNVGDEVEFELSDAGCPLYASPDRKTGKPTDKYGRGVVTSCTEDYVYTSIPHHESSSWNRDSWSWLIRPGTLALPGYIRLVNKVVKPVGCQCDSHDLAWVGHMPDCPDAPKPKRNKYL